MLLMSSHYTCRSRFCFQDSGQHCIRQRGLNDTEQRCPYNSPPLPFFHPFTSDMAHNSNLHLDSLQKLQVYAVSITFLKNVGWTQGQVGHVAINKSSCNPLVAIAVSKVNEFKLTCGPTGNFNPKFNTLDKAKFCFTLECPPEPAYLEDWEKLLIAMDKVQSGIALTKDRHNLLDTTPKVYNLVHQFSKKRYTLLNHPPFSPIVIYLCT